jgi:hypothetical protein
MLLSTFERDMRTRVFGEISKLTGNPGRPDNLRRLKPLPEVARLLALEKASIIIAKPLVDSQNILELLDYFPGARAIWLYRGYKNVAYSNIKLFGAESMMKNLSPLFADPPIEHWAIEGASAETKRIIHHYFSETMPPFDAAALFWYMRNMLFYELAQDQNSRVFLCQYEAIAAEPGQVMSQIYRFLGCRYPANGMVKGIHDKAIRLEDEVELNPEIDRLCASLLHRLDETYQTQMAQAGPVMQPGL